MKPLEELDFAIVEQIELCEMLTRAEQQLAPRTFLGQPITGDGKVHEALLYKLQPLMLKAREELRLLIVRKWEVTFGQSQPECEQSSAAAEPAHPTEQEPVTPS